MLHEKLLVIFGVCSPPYGTSNRTKMFFAVLSFCITIVPIAMIVDSILFVARMTNYNFQVALYIFLQATAFFTSLTMYLILALFHRSQLKDIFDEFNATLSKCEELINI